MKARTPHPPIRRYADDDVILGSNNWAVAPARSASGYALLAGDPAPPAHTPVHLVRSPHRRPRPARRRRRDSPRAVPASSSASTATWPGPSPTPAVTCSMCTPRRWMIRRVRRSIRLDGSWRPLELARRSIAIRRDTSSRPTPRASPIAARCGSTPRGGRRSAGPCSSLRSETDLFLRAARAVTADEWLEIMRVVRGADPERSRRRPQRLHRHPLRRLVSDPPR